VTKIYLIEIEKPKLFIFSSVNRNYAQNYSNHRFIAGHLSIIYSVQAEKIL
jgi:hypothetical protein